MTRPLLTLLARLGIAGGILCAAVDAAAGRLAGVVSAVITIIAALVLRFQVARMYRR